MKYTPKNLENQYFKKITHIFSLNTNTTMTNMTLYTKHTSKYITKEGTKCLGNLRHHKL